ncbi:MAG: hypothetical protein ACI9D4_002278, partial [Polaribacter sp.]
WLLASTWRLLAIRNFRKHPHSIITKEKLINGEINTL